MDNDIFTVDQVARMLDLHPKTVRRFIREGKLNARKVGGQWRITRQDIEACMGGQSLSGSEATLRTIPKKDQDGTRGNITGKIQVSAVVDVFVTDKEEASRLSTSILASMHSRDPDLGAARCDSIFYEEELRVRFILWGTPAFISIMLSFLETITTDQ
jgi:excisionase family DNA binding protein